MDLPRLDALPLSRGARVLVRVDVNVPMHDGQIVDDLDAAAARAILDPEVRARMLADPQSRSLFQAFRATVGDRFALRLAGTRQDVLIGRAPAPPP